MVWLWLTPFLVHSILQFNNELCLPCRIGDQGPVCYDRTGEILIGRDCMDISMVVICLCMWRADRMGGMNIIHIVLLSFLFQFIFRYSVGLIPVLVLNSLLKCCGYLKPKS